ncbi:TIGR04222 domain-containing membrane protein [Streptomyces antarcticus]|uniref:TIGR04222 domain-containing membrane protein n=1 Tax=Streptomyces antarcticus TaxID=2996458 RepID=UPI002271DCCA|nr:MULTISPECIES: TIGR04222 domain-containing membrane protein [unclassified Streptomyces]MCY0945398.1 TIGR04222 domain-containing membrane protein [Streptomyces sp. H34-AA3]MCZ4085298.1 TIGR04222 domain-containing membrane protein [Streptomyces sp. H34-S5]
MSGGQQLGVDIYETAHLAGGPRRVAEVAVLGLRDRGAVTVTGPRVRAAREAGGGVHPVERAVLRLCPRGKALSAVLAAVAAGPETAAVRRALVEAGLLGRRRPTAAGQRVLAAARADGQWPAYVFGGWPAPPKRRRSTRHSPLDTSMIGRALDRIGRTLDRGMDRAERAERADRAEHGDHPGHSCGGSGGGGGD